MADRKKHFRRASNLFSLVSKFPSPVDLFSFDVPGLCFHIWLLVSLDYKCSILTSFASSLLKALTIIAFHGGHINLETFKIVLSIGPTFVIMNFMESKFFAYSK